MSAERLSILVLDDDPEITALIEDVLGTACAVTIANTIDEAIATLTAICAQSTVGGDPLQRMK